MPTHDERAVDLFLMGIAFARLNKKDEARRSMNLARYAENHNHGREYTDATLFLAALSGPAGDDLIAAAEKAEPRVLEPEAVDELLWLLGVPKNKRQTAITRLNLRQQPDVLSWAVRIDSTDNAEALEKAQALLIAAKQRLGFA